MKDDWVPIDFPADIVKAVSEWLEAADGSVGLCLVCVECPARFVPVEMRQTGTRGVEYGTRQEAYGGADRESAATG
jgi:hypothetical protein